MLTYKVNKVLIMIPYLTVKTQNKHVPMLWHKINQSGLHSNRGEKEEWIWSHKINCYFLQLLARYFNHFCGTVIKVFYGNVINRVWLSNSWYCMEWLNNIFTLSQLLLKFHQSHSWQTPQPTLNVFIIFLSDFTCSS